MARKILNKEPSLNELIVLYGENNTECNALKKKVADLNAQLKLSIHKAKKENKDIEINGWKCHLTVSDDSKFNEDRLIEFAKQNKLDIIKTKEYIDFDEMEKLIYNGNISKELLLEMDKCKDKSVKETLRVTKLKED